MRIRRIHIDSFGQVRDRDFTVSPEMTVFHGPNESGKTTLMEFIRWTLVPTRGRKLYPERRNSDRGEIDYTEDGNDGTLELEQKSRRGDVPECVSKLQPDLYRSIFALDQASLSDSELLDSGELGQRFLTVPGSAGFTKAVETVRKETDELLGKTKKSPSELMSIENEIDGLDADIAELKAKADTYGGLSREKEELELKLAALKESSVEDAKRRDLYKSYESQAENYRQLAEFRRERSEMGMFMKVTEEGERNYRSLKSDWEAKRKLKNDSADRCREQKSRLAGTDPVTLQDNMSRMESVVGDYSLYRSMKERRAPARQEPVYREKPDMRLVAAGAVLLVLGLVLTTVSMASLALAGVGALVTVLGFVRKVRVEVSSRTIPAEDHSKEVSEYESEVLEIVRLLGRNHTTVDSDVSLMKGLLGTYPHYQSAQENYRSAREDFNRADMALMQFTNGFGGEERFLRYMECSKKAGMLESRIRQLSEAIRASGLDPDQPECPVGEVVVDNSEELETSRRIGEIGRKMEELMDTEALDRLIDRRSALKARRKEVLRSGAVAYLATVIAEMTSEDAYEEMHPGVIVTADRYLGMMTDGRYSFDIDPAKTEVAVKDSDGRKNILQCSTGLRAQVLLSVKLAIAKELGDGEVPVILDDVLLPFDSTRKQGAVRALAEVSKEMQILMFTCDDQTRDLAAGSGVDVVPM